MMDGKCLGKIDKVEFGFNDRDWLVLTFYLSGKMWYTHDVDLYEPELISCFSTFTMWSAVDPQFGDKVTALLRRARKSNVMSLAGTPIEMEIEGNIMKDWRVLDEVL